MTQELERLLRQEADRVQAPPPPVDAILAAARRRRRVRRSRSTLLAVVTAVAVVAGVILSGRGLLVDSGVARPTPPAAAHTAVTPTPDDSASGSLEVSSRGVGGQPFGTEAGDVLARVSARFGQPDQTEGPQRYFRQPDNGEIWFEDADDPLSPSWRYPVVSMSCWGSLCLVFGGQDPDSLRLRGWELSGYRHRSGRGEHDTHPEPDVRLAGSGIRLGDTWHQLHAAYPGAVVAGGEGASVAVRSTPWPGISDGVGAWRLSGVWDYSHPHQAPHGAVVTRLSGGEGPEPGCC
jgi:hypothetical protein